MGDVKKFEKDDARLVVVGVCLAVLLYCAYALLFPKWEYKTLKLLPEQKVERVDKDAFSYATIAMNEETLARMGADGWELVSSALEMETAFPNFGKSEYVTGLQTNVRPQALLLLFKRQKHVWR